MPVTCLNHISRVVGSWIPSTFGRSISVIGPLRSQRVPQYLAYAGTGLLPIRLSATPISGINRQEAT